jgi:dolichol-phosphate mannosyltransferase
VIWVLLFAQGIAGAILLSRLAAGRRRVPAVEPLATGVTDTSVTVLLPTLNEAERIAPCLAALARQGPPLAEIVVVDSGSTDGTPALVLAAAAGDPRLRLLRDPPLPGGWIGKVWALQHGLAEARGEWILGVDADTEAEPGMVAAVVDAARRHDLELVSFSPAFAGQSWGERLAHPALLLTLVYRFGPPRVATNRPDRVVANGQCFLVRRDVLLAHGGYEPARRSFADDVALARHCARAGVRTGFLDGSRLYRVRSYRSLAELWREWGRSIDLGDVTPAPQQWLDILFLTLVQALPVPVLALFTLGACPAGTVAGAALLGINGALLGVRLLMLGALAGAYQRPGLPYLLSWLADPLAVLRIAWSTIRRPRAWRGRRYSFR